jgi:hypothetical protein
MTHAVLSAAPKDGAFSQKQILVIQQFLDAASASMSAEMKQLMSDLGISESCALDVAYLRTRSRHSPELEQKLIALHKVGTPPQNIFEFM